MFAPFIAPIISFLVTFFAFLIKHPFVLKMMIFALFTALIASSLTFIFLMVKPYIVSNSIIALALYARIQFGHPAHLHLAN